MHLDHLVSNCEKFASKGFIIIILLLFRDMDKKQSKTAPLLKVVHEILIRKERFSIH